MSTILVVEDEALIRTATCMALEDAGYAVVEARDADQAIAILENRPDIRIVFTDIDMPGSMDGLKLAHFVRNKWPPIKIIVASGKVKLGDNDLPQGARFFPKPYGETALIQTIASFLS